MGRGAFPVADAHGVATEIHLDALFGDRHLGSHGRSPHFADAHAIEDVQHIPGLPLLQQFPDQAAFHADIACFLIPHDASRADGALVERIDEVGNAHLLAHGHHACFGQDHVAQGREQQKRPPGQTIGSFLHRIVQGRAPGLLLAARLKNGQVHCAAQFQAAQDQTPGKGREFDAFYFQRIKAEKLRKRHGFRQVGQFQAGLFLHLRAQPELQGRKPGQNQHRQDENHADKTFHACFFLRLSPPGGGSPDLQGCAWPPG